MVRETHEFYLKFAHSMAGCQLVEQQLKLYIAEALQLAQICIGTRLTFKLSGEDYEDASLERLIGMFRNLSDNDALVRSLDSFKRERNFLSHTAITSCLDPDRHLSEPESSNLQSRLKSIQTESDRLVASINDEANRFRGHLYFGNLDGQAMRD